MRIPRDCSPPATEGVKRTEVTTHTELHRWAPEVNANELLTTVCRYIEPPAFAHASGLHA